MRGIVSSAALVAAPLPSLFSRDFVLFLVALGSATLGIQIQGTVVGYEMYQLTRDPLSLGTIGLAEALPFILLSLLGGHVADRRDRRNIVLAAFAAMVAAALGLWALAGRAQLAPTLHQLGMYALIVVGGVCRAFMAPARTALSAQLVPRIQFARAVTWRTGIFQLTSIVGPSLGGVLIAWVGAHNAYLATVALLLVALLAMAAVRPPARAAAPPAVTGVFGSVAEGVRFLARDRVLTGAITLDLFAVLFGGATALLPVFAAEILHVGPTGFGVLRAANGVGALLASAYLAVRPPMAHAGRTLLVAVAGFGVAMIGFALSRWFALSLFLLAASGALDMVSVLVRSTLLQLRVPDHLLGRVSSVNQIFIGSSNEIGAFESGVAARLLGTVPSVVFGGSVTLAVVSLVAWRAPELRRLSKLE
jgi:MFS family permease